MFKLIKIKIEEIKISCNSIITYLYDMILLTSFFRIGIEDIIGYIYIVS